MSLVRVEILDRTSLRSRFASFWVMFFRRETCGCFKSSLSSRLMKAASTTFPPTSLFPSLRFWSLYHPLRFCKSLFFQSLHSLIFSALRVRSSSRISKNSPPARGGSLFRRPLDSLSQLAGGHEHWPPSMFFLFSFFLQRNFFSTRVKILFRWACNPPSSKILRKKKEKNTDGGQCSCFVHSNIFCRLVVLVHRSVPSLARSTSLQKIFSEQNRLRCSRSLRHTRARCADAPVFRTPRASSCCAAAAASRCALSQIFNLRDGLASGPRAGPPVLCPQET